MDIKALQKYPDIIHQKYPENIQNIHFLSRYYPWIHGCVSKISIGYTVDILWIHGGYFMDIYIYIHDYMCVYPWIFFRYIVDTWWIFYRYISMDICVYIHGYFLDILWIHGGYFMDIYPWIHVCISMDIFWIYCGYLMDIYPWIFVCISMDTFLATVDTCGYFLDTLWIFSNMYQLQHSII